jgi:hypothetical protein
VLAGGLAAILLLAAPTGLYAGSHHIEFDSVDGREIRYVDHTRYDGGLAAGRRRWNALGQVSIVRDGPCCTADLEYDDHRDPSSNLVAYYQSRAGVDLINFNRYYLDRYSARNRRHIGVHETGHALGLGDHDTGRYRGIVMYHAVNGIEAPQRHDRSDYRRRWAFGWVFPPGPPGVRDIEALHAFPPADASRLVGFADHVFLGTVIAETGTAPIDTSSPDPASFVPRTTFRVRVETNLKGRLAGEVTVAQAGGVDPVDGAQLRVDGDPPLVPGTSYLLLTRRDAAHGLHNVVAPGWGDLPAVTAPVRAALLARYRSVVRRQILFDLEAVTRRPPAARGR